MQRATIHSPSFAPDHRVVVDWSSLLDAMGTLQFDQVLQRFVSTLAGPDGFDKHLNQAFTDTSGGQSGWKDSSNLGHRLASAGDALTAIVRKHIEAVHARGERESGEPLSRLAGIERCLADCTGLPRRELEVCSRILFGMSSVGIALDLNLCETTVKTYRKRAYQRLCVGCERQLITWYLRTWNSWPQTRTNYSRM